MFHKKVLVYIMAAVMFAALLGLGLWQMQRLEWKESLLSQIEARMAMDAERIVDKIDAPQEWEYRRVTLNGKYVNHRPLLIQPRTHKGQNGYHVIMLFDIYKGGAVFVNRGWVPQDYPQKQLNVPSLRRTIEGVVQLPFKGTFTPENDPDKGYWYWPDIQAMAKKIGAENPLPVVVTLPAQEAGVYPTGYDVTANLRNNHRLYAIFWFSMALVLVVVFVMYQKKQGDT